MTTMFIIGIFLLIAYIVTYCVIHKEIPYSVSETYYLIKYPKIFSFTLVGTAFLIAPFMIENFSFWGFLSCELAPH